MCGLLEKTSPSPGKFNLSQHSKQYRRQATRQRTKKLFFLLHPVATGDSSLETAVMQGRRRLDKSPFLFMIYLEFDGGERRAD
jgi:hypothetical protein